MICLDTNYLIRGIVAATSEAEQLSGWYRAGEPIITPMPAWFEFLCEPLTDMQEATIRAFLSRIVPFDEGEAVESARLFNANQRTLAVVGYAGPNHHEKRRKIEPLREGLSFVLKIKLYQVAGHNAVRSFLAHSM